MKINNFDKQNLATLRLEIQTALNTIGAAHGINLSLGNISYDMDGQSFSSKISARVINAAAQRQITEMVSNPTTLIGKCFKLKNTTYKVTGYNPSKPKYCFSVITDNGKRWSVPANFFQNAVEVTAAWKLSQMALIN